MRQVVRSTGAMVAMVAFLAAGMTSCSSMNNKERGAVIGAAGGAAVGGVIGNQTGSTARGAIIGAVVGGAAGAVIGHQMDQQAEELDEELNAEVERVGEGIQVTFDSGLLFDFDSSELRAPARTNLSDLAESLHEYPRTEVVIVGHTDAQGTEEYNQGLSQRRANSAAQYLMVQGVDRTRIRTTGRGELEPVATNETASGRQLNRRVEVAIFASEEYREEVQRREGR